MLAAVATPMSEPLFADPVLWSRRKRYLVGVSGGADSVALLHLMIEAGLTNLVVCHLDHRLRGKDSTGDARFVTELAENLGLSMELGHAEVKRQAKESGQSLETAARHARHAFFADCAARHRCPRVVLAHHADDQAETVLWNLLRGSHGTKGMRASQSLRIASRQLQLLRPLLSLRRKELRSWLCEQGHKWREDATNAEAFAIRNRLRNEAIPLLEDIVGRSVAPSLLRAAQAGEDTEAITDWALTQANVLDPQSRLHLPALRALPAALQRAALHRYLSTHGVPDLDRATIDRALTLTSPDAAPRLSLPGGFLLQRRTGRMFLTAS